MFERGLRRMTIPYFVGFLIAFAPFTIHNLFVSKQIVPLSPRSGISFYLGNNGFTNGTYAPPLKFGEPPETIDIYDSNRVAEADLGRTLDPTEISSYWYGRGFRFIRDEPIRFVRLLGQKTALYFNGFEIPLDHNYDYDRRFYPTLRLTPVSFGVLLSLGLVGIFLVPRRRSRGHLPILFMAANAVSVIAFFVCARYRLAAVPVLAIFAALTLVTWAEHLIARRWRCAAMIGAAALLIAVPIHLDLYRGRTDGAARSAVIAGRAWADAGEMTRAASAFREALDLVPSHVDAWMNLGILHYRNGSFGEAAAAFEAVTRSAPAFAGAWSHLGLAHGAAGRFDDAAAAHGNAITVDPRSAHAWENLADLFVEQGDFSGAMESLGRATDRMPGDERILQKRSRVDRAARAYHQALISLERGDAAGAERYLRDAFESGGDPMRRFAERDESIAALLQHEGDRE